MRITNTLSCAVFQRDQQSSGAEAGGGDTDVVTQAYREHRRHLLCLLHYLWHPWRPGERKGRYNEHQCSRLATLHHTGSENWLSLVAGC